MATNFIKTTEQESVYKGLEHMSAHALLEAINSQDKLVPHAVEKEIDAIEKLALVVAAALKKGGRLFYIGAGTSGRLGIVDASECPPTFGVEQGLVVGIIAGGDSAIRQAVEFAEDDTQAAWLDLNKHNITPLDVVVGIAASGSTPYVVGGLKACREAGIVTGCITCNAGSPIIEVSDYPIQVVVGPEFVTGSTRMKAGTAQKLVLNMLSTTVMILLGKVEGNKMVNMQLSNDKLIHRGIEMLRVQLGVSLEEAQHLLRTHGNVKKAIEEFNK